MKWTKEQPTHDGYYWVQLPGNPPAVGHVIGKYVVYASGSYSLSSPLFRACTWCGPIEPPADGGFVAIPDTKKPPQ